MSKLSTIQNIYFIGIGGIGMSALARYFKSRGASVSGYDRAITPLTRELEAEGIDVHFEEDINMIPKNVDVVVYTPAIPADHEELVAVRVEQPHAELPPRHHLGLTLELDASLLELRVGGLQVRRRERDARVDAHLERRFLRVPARHRERDVRRRAGWRDGHPAHRRSHRRIIGFLPAENVTEEVDCLVLVRDDDGRCMDVRDHCFSSC